MIGLPDEDLGHVVHAIVQVEGEVDDAELLTHLRDRLAAYKLPRASGLKALATVPTEAGRLVHRLDVPVHEAILCEVVA